MRVLTKFMIAGSLLSISTLSTAVDLVANEKEALALTILKKIEVNTFRNSLRPRHLPEGTTIDQLPIQTYEELEEDKGAYTAIDDEGSWAYSVAIMEQSPKGITICFTDQSLTASYLSATKLLVRKNKRGNYAVTNELPTTSDCEITRAP